MKDKIFVCQRCQVRLEKSANFQGVGFRWSPDSFKELKLKFIRMFGKKPKKKVVLTSCLGYCPDKLISYEETQDGLLQGAQDYSPELDKDSVFKLFFK